MMKTRAIVLAMLIGAPAAAQGPANPDPAEPDETAKAGATTDRGMAGERTLVDQLDEDQPLEVGAQLRIFRQARKRRSEIERMEGMLDRRARRLDEIQLEIESRYKTLRMIQEEIAASANDASAVPVEDAIEAEEKVREARQDKVKKLSKVVDKMKAADAAKMLGVMDESLVVDVMLLVKSKSAARILGEMDPKQAARIGEKMARIKKRRQTGGR